MPDLDLEALRGTAREALANPPFGTARLHATLRTLASAVEQLADELESRQRAYVHVENSLSLQLKASREEWAAMFERSATAEAEVERLRAENERLRMDRGELMA